MLDSSTNATVAKARAFHGKRLKEEDYRELLKRESIPEIAEYLKHGTHFSSCLASIDTNSIHRGHLEEILNRETYNQYIRLCSFQKLNKIEFFNYRTVISEISEIIRCVTYINAGASEEFVDNIPTYLLKYASFDLMGLASVRSYDDLLAVIEKTPYYDVIKDEKPGDDGNYDCTQLDTKLRTYYIRWAERTVKENFVGKTEKDMLEIIYCFYELNNIYNAFRFKAFSQAPESEIKEILLPVRSRITKTKKTELLNAFDADNYIDILENTGYGRQMRESNPEMSKSTIQHDIQLLKNRYAKLFLRRTTNAAVSLYTILFLLTTEVKNITTIIEGVRYGVPSQEIEKLLVIV